MHWFRTYELALGVLLTVSVVAVLLAVNAVVPPDATGWSWGLFKDASGFFALCAVLVASVQAIFFVVQLHYMRRTIELTARTWVFAGPQNIRQAARYVKPTPTTTERIPVFLFEMHAINYGKAPAIVTHLLIGFASEEPSGAPTYDRCTRVDASFLLGPDRDHFRFIYEGGRDGLFSTDLDAPFVFGLVAYEAGGVLHTSRFSVRLTSSDTATNAGPPGWHRFT